ncbi:hypothetical protein DLM76_01380 [Leptospira yasudae]|nr:hypothetical protein DLM76_01380 [Leptospira yasudae]
MVPFTALFQTDVKRVDKARICSQLSRIKLNFVVIFGIFLYVESESKKEGWNLQTKLEEI